MLVLLAAWSSASVVAAGIGTMTLLCSIVLTSALRRERYGVSRISSRSMKQRGL